MQRMDLGAGEVLDQFAKPVTAQVTVGSPVWVEDPTLMWIEATVTHILGNKITSETRNGNTVVSSIENVYPRDEETPSNGLDDMTKLSYLHEPGVLQNLYIRYQLDMIYTYTGNILIAVNPFQKMPHLFGTHMMEEYRNARLGDLSPHIYAVADAAYKAMMDEQRSQAVLVSGESGAGKTETTKLLMQYLAFMGGRSGVEGRTVEQQVLESNPLLEAFGNAKTIRNNNSSRFGKFVEIQFNRGKISGAAVRTYLLERSRVVQISNPERNYHCFYQLCAGASSEEAKRYKLLPASSFRYLNQSECLNLPRLDEAEQYRFTRNAMDIVGISPEEQDAIFRVVAAILHLGNIEFEPGSEPDSSCVADGSSRFHLQAAAELLMCNEKKLADSLTTRIIVTVGESVIKSLDVAAAVGSRDTLAKTLYARLFDWLVDKVNMSIGQDPQSTVLIGVLDIYGFESFTVNSFEQFCINLTNEKLQQHFNTHVFKTEQEEYKREEISWSDIEFLDNIDVLDLIEKKPLGIIALLDEACMFPKSTPQSFSSLLYSTFTNHKRFRRPKFGRTSFAIDHYAGEVTYSADLFLEKNRDYIIDEHRQLMNASKCAFVANLFPPPEETRTGGKHGARGGSSFSSIGSRFKLQLQSLMETLSTTQPHYVRCVKPNTELLPQKFSNGFVLQQLRCSGVLEAVRISCAGFPTRRTFAEFVDRFLLLCPDAVSVSADDKAACIRILEHVDLKGYQVGRTKVFLRGEQMAILDTRRTEIVNRAAALVTRKARTFLLMRAFRRLRKASVAVQTHWRGLQARRELELLRRHKAATEIQRFVRGRIQWKQYSQMQSSATKIQSCARMLYAKREAQKRRENRAAKIIQAQWRRCSASKNYHDMLFATRTLQCAWRRKVARLELRHLRQQARETGALREAKNRLEKQVEELTLRWELEKRKTMDIEATKKAEVARVMEMMEQMKEQVEETKSALLTERQKYETAVEQAQEASREAAAAEARAAATQAALEEIQRLREENDKLKEKVEAAESRASEVAAKLQEVIAAKEELAVRIQEERANSESLRQTLESMEERMDGLHSENKLLRQQALDMVKIEEMAREDSIRLKDQAETISRLESANEELQKLAERVNELESEKSSLEKQLLRLEELEAEKEELEVQKGAWMSQKEGLEMQVAEAEARKQEAEHRAKELEVQKAEVEKDAVQKVTELQSENAKLLRVSEEGAEFRQAEIEAQAAQKFAEMQCEIDRLKKENQVVQKVAELESENARLKQHVSSVVRKADVRESPLLVSEASPASSSSDAMPHSQVRRSVSASSSSRTSVSIPVKQQTPPVPVSPAERPSMVPPSSGTSPGKIIDPSLSGVSPSTRQDANGGASLPSSEQVPSVTAAIEAQLPALIAQMAPALVAQMAAAAPSIVAQMAANAPNRASTGKSTSDPSRRSGGLLPSVQQSKEGRSSQANGVYQRRPVSLLSKHFDFVAMKEMGSARSRQGPERAQNEKDTRPEAKARVRPGEQGLAHSVSDLVPGETKAAMTHSASQSFSLGDSSKMKEPSPSKMMVKDPSSSRVKDPSPSRPVDQRRQRERNRLSKIELDLTSLLQTMEEDVGFDGDHPVAAVVIFKSLYHWNSFEAERTSVFTRIISKINSFVDHNVETNSVLAYWLSNTSALLNLMHRTFKPTSAALGGRSRRSAVVSQSLQVPRGTLASMKGAVGASFNQLPRDHAGTGEAKYPALLFKQQLAASVEKVYTFLRDNLKKDLIPVISQCIKAPKRTKSFSASARRPTAAEEDSSNWDAMIKIMTENMNILREKRVPPFLIRHLFTQMFSFINVQLFNSLLLRRECCSLSNGLYMREGIKQLALWFRATGTEYAGRSWEELQHIRQAVEFLVFQRKPKASLDEIMRRLCPDLSVQQLYRITTMYWDEKYQTKPVTQEVMSMLRSLMIQESDESSESGNSFLLEDNTTIPFSVDEVATSISEFDLMNIKPPALLKNMPSFYFLKPLRERHASISFPERNGRE